MVCFCEWRNENAYEEKKKHEGNGRRKIVRFFFGACRSPGQRMIGIGVGLLVMMLAVSSLICLHFGEGITAVSADAGVLPCVSDSDAEPHYGHLFIDTDPEGVFEKQEDAEGTVDLCHQSLAIYPDENEKVISVTLYGMMPEGATAEAVDVTHNYPDADDVSSETVEDATVVAAYNITINDGENEFQPTEARPIRVEITSPQIVTEGVTEVWHIKDDGTREQITDFKIADGQISFLAAGFSVYAIVNGPEPYTACGYDAVPSVSDLTGDKAAWGFYLYYADDNGEHFFENTLNDKGALKEAATIASAAPFFFEPVGGSYKIYTYVGNAKKYIHPMPGYEDLVSGNDGVIQKIDNTLDPGKYYLTELTPPAGHEGLSGDIVFTVGDNGQVTMNSTEYIDMLYESPSELESAYFIDVRNELIPAFSQLTVTKTVAGMMGNTEQDFTFTLTVDGAPDSESYEWSKNGVAQSSPLHSGDTFTLRHGENVVVTLPNYFNVTVSEANENYTTTFRPDGGEAQEGNSLTLQLTEDKTVDVTNRRDMILPTGVSIDLIAPACILLLALGGAAFILLRCRRAKVRQTNSKEPSDNGTPEPNE